MWDGQLWLVRSFAAYVLQHGSVYRQDFSSINRVIRRSLWKNGAKAEGSCSSFIFMTRLFLKAWSEVSFLTCLTLFRCDNHPIGFKGGLHLSPVQLDFKWEQWSVCIHSLTGMTIQQVSHRRCVLSTHTLVSTVTLESYVKLMCVDSYWEQTGASGVM